MKINYYTKEDFLKEEWNFFLDYFNINGNVFLDYQTNENLKTCKVEVIRKVCFYESKPIAIIQFVKEKIKINRFMSIIKVSCGIREGEGFLYKENKEIKCEQIIKIELEKIIKEIPKCNLIYVSFVFPTTSNFLEGYSVKKINSVELNLNNDIAKIEKDMNKKRRNGIKKAIKNGVQVNIENSKKGLDFFYDLKTKYYWNNQEKTIWNNRSKKMFYSFHQNQISSGINNIFLATYLGEMIAFVNINKVGKKIYYKEGGLNKIFQNVRPLDLLLIEVIKWGKQNNCENIDFCGGNLDKNGKPDSITKYKLQFGGKIIDYYHYKKILLPFLRRRIPIDQLI